MAGLPPFIGFMAKEEIYYAIAKPDAWSIAITVLTIFGNALMLVIGAAVAILPFMGKKVETPKHAHEGPVLLWLGPVVLAISGLVSAILAGFTNVNFISPMASAIAGESVTAKAAIVFPSGRSADPFSRHHCARCSDLLETFNGADWPWQGLCGQSAGDRIMASTSSFLVLSVLSTLITRFLQNGRMEAYMTTVFLVFGVSVWASLLYFDELPRLAYAGSPVFL